MTDIIPIENIRSRIYIIRGQKVILDRDIATLYEVETRTLNQAVKRNIERFPSNFMFKISKNEAKLIRSQFVILEKPNNWFKYEPMAFTEHGVAMLSGILSSPRAVSINIAIINAFIQLRNAAIEESDLHRKIEVLEKQYDENFKIVFDALRRIMHEESQPKPEIGFKYDESE